MSQAVIYQSHCALVCVTCPLFRYFNYFWEEGFCYDILTVNLMFTDHHMKQVYTYNVRYGRIALRKIMCIQTVT